MKQNKSPTQVPRHGLPCQVMNYRPRLRCLPKTLEVSIIYEVYFIVSGQRKAQADLRQMARHSSRADFKRGLKSLSHLFPWAHIIVKNFA